jgi:hypothetical protein
MCLITGMARTLSRFSACLPVLGLTFLAACGETSIPTLEGDALNPEAHRAQIVVLDAILFEDGPLGEAERGEVEKTLLVVRQAAIADPSNGIAMMLGKDLQRLAGMVKSSRAGTPLLNSPLRQYWLRIRNSLFADAAWFRYSSRDPIEPAVAKMR